MLRKIFLSDKEIIRRIHANDRSILGELFLSNEKPISTYIKKNGGDSSDGQDMLQEAIIALWQNVNNGRYQQTAKISTYLFAIAKNKWMAESRRRQRLDFDLKEAVDSEQNENALSLVIDKERKKIVAQALEQLGSPCRELLIFFYFEERTMSDIAKIMNFANSDVAKTKKYQCKKALEHILKDFLKEEQSK